MSNYPSWQVTLAIIHLYWIYILEYRCTDQQDICIFRASSVLCLNTNCTVSTRAWHKSTNHAGERTSDTCILIAWTIDLLNNMLWEGRLLQRPKQLKIINHKVNKTMHSTDCFSAAFTSCFPLMKPRRAPCIQIMSFFAKIIIFHWLIYYIYMQNICVVFRVKCEEWQVGCHTYYYYFFGRVYRCNFHFNFRQCNMILWS